MSEVTSAVLWQDLRKPFPKGTVGSLPKPYKKDSPKGKCNECGGWHGLPAVHLDYVGHAAVTDRLNTVVGPDQWSLDPLVYDEHGFPAVNANGEMWFKLTILGATKICVGDGSTDAKQLIGDGLRNGAMRFGIALDLWTKDELESTLEAPERKNERPSQAPVEPSKALASITTAQVTELFDLAKIKGFTDKQDAIEFLNGIAMLNDFTKMPVSDLAEVKKAIIVYKKAADAAEALEGKV